MKFSAVMSRSLFAKEGSDALDVYFSAYNPTESLPSTLRKRSYTTFRPIRYSTSISIPRSGKLKKEVLENMDFASFRAIFSNIRVLMFTWPSNRQMVFPTKDLQS